MLRQLLTLLAVFTGLAAACEPARVDAPGVEQVRFEPGAQAAAASAIATRIFRSELARIDGLAGAGTRWRQFRQPLPVPTVILGADRARE